MTAGSVTERHLRRLRWQLTVLYAVAMALALGVLVYVVIRVDNNLRESDMEGTLLEQAQRAASAVVFGEDGVADVSRFADDTDLTQGWPQTYLYGAQAGSVFLLAGPATDWYDVDVRDAAATTLYDGATWPQWVATLDSGSDVVARGVALLDPISDEPRVAAVAVVDSADFFADQAALRNRVLAAAAFLVLAASAAGYWVAGRATRETAGVLVQQEQLLSNAAHELRTPVARIRAVSEGGLAGDEPAQDALEHVAALSADAGTMVDDMLFLARMDADKAEINKEPLRLDLLAEQVANRHDGVKIEAVETIVDGDAGLLRRAIDNLLRNAAIHGEGRDVKVTVYPKVVMVCDRGPGLDASLGEQAFERFHTGPSSPGHGLGLPIVRWVVNVHGGTVTLSNRNDGGVEARITLPA